MTKTIKYITDKPWFLFFIIAFIFGGLMLFITPPNGVADENGHVLRACETADGILYNKIPSESTKYDKLFDFLPPREENTFHYMSGYSPVMYMASAAGIKIGSILTGNGLFIFYLCRFLNLIVYIMLSAFAIKITPAFKYHFLFIALLPMALFEGMSFSADSFNNGFAFLFFAFIFKLIFDKEEITKKDYIILFIFSIIGAFCKGLIYPLLLFFFLPKFSYDFKYKNKYIYILPVIIFSLFICFFWHHINNVVLNPDLSEYNRADIIFSKPLDVLYIIFNTTILSLKKYIFGIIGIFGNPAGIYLPSAMYTGCIYIFFLSLIILGERIKLIYRLVSLLTFIIFYISVLYMMLINWTGINANEIIGVQGRYFIPAIPFLFLSLSFHISKISEKYKIYFKFFLLLFIIYLLILSNIILYNYYHILGINA